MKNEDDLRLVSQESNEDYLLRDHLLFRILSPHGPKGTQSEHCYYKLQYRTTAPLLPPVHLMGLPPFYTNWTNGPALGHLAYSKWLPETT